MHKDTPIPMRNGELMNQKGKEALQVIIRSPGGQLKEVVLESPGLTWNEVYCELDRMSRAGQVRVTPRSPGCYAVSNPTACHHPA